MNTQHIPHSYGLLHESKRRLQPRLWDSDYCLLKGLADNVKKFVQAYIQPEMTILDFGCGAKPYRSLFPNTCDYKGIDSCSNPHADIEMQPGQRVALPAGVADCIVSTQVVYLIPDYRFYLKECHRLLKSDGHMLITSHGTWSYHPASGGDYYRFTHDGLRQILDDASFEVIQIVPIVGTLGTGLHLRQLVFNAWLKHIPFGSLFSKLLNIIINLRILLEDKCTPIGTRLSSPVILACVAKPKSTTCHAT